MDIDNLRWNLTDIVLETKKEVILWKDRVFRQTKIQNVAYGKLFKQV